MEQEFTMSMYANKNDLIAALQKRARELEKENASLKQDAARYRWLSDQTGLLLESDSMMWTRRDGSKYTSTHFLAVNGTCHTSLESLDLTIDAAMRSDKETYA